MVGFILKWSDGMQDNNLRSLARKTAFYCQSAIGLAGFAA